MSFGYVVGRIVQAGLTVLGVIALIFVLISLAPGDVVDALGEGADPAGKAQLREDLGLDRPVSQQLLSYGARAVRGDLGVSILQNNRPVTDIIGDYLPATLLLMGTALALSTAGGIVLGCVVARAPNRGLDKGAGLLALLAYAMPVFWLGQMAVLLVALKLRALPPSGMGDSRADYAGFDRAFDIMRHLALPALVLAVSEVALVFRVTRAGVLEQAQKDYVRTAVAKGMSDDKALSHHALRNALLPLVTILGSRLGFLFSGAVAVEWLFAWPGIGSLLIASTQQRDRPVVVGATLIVAIGIVFANLLTDLIYGWIDPRIRND